MTEVLPAAATAPAGVPVELGNVERELKKLWAEGGDVMSRASLINLAVYSEAPDSLAANTKIISELTEEHACRAIVVTADPAASSDKLEAWINAHCHVSRAGGKQVCSEQLSFSLAGSSAKLLPNIVFAHLDSDLPLYFWWQDEFHDPMDAQLWSWVDRLIYDSRGWHNAPQQLRLLDEAQAETKHRVVLCDLNWTRLVQLRLALAQFFDCADARERLEEIARVEIEFAPSYRSTAILLVGWLAAQLHWKSIAEFEFTSENGRPVTITLGEKTGEMIRRCSLFGARSEYRVEHKAGSNLLEVSRHTNGKERLHQLMPAGRNDPVSLMREELMRGGPHRVYLRAVEAVRGFL
ncbi:MAG: glucose-6-phosphate dehydrogenase assembly protein OpcA [Verrucomicrobiota bacterium]|nr:glucose-6-phosphate dehydrogenase assembly protein OpcA [Verrucomicrobiota bacterium]